ncbi:MAG: isochorismatase family protein [Microbacterium sp.]|uniref:isochorismatase family protein n=1 Tax=Microbacterium sp. TaxID=51671 RepID=UPI003BB21873
MSAPRRALIVIDPQQEYFTGLLPIQYPPRDESIRRIADAVDAAERAGIPVVMVQHDAGDDAPVFGPTKQEFRPPSRCSPTGLARSTSRTRRDRPTPRRCTRR